MESESRNVFDNLKKALGTGYVLQNTGAVIISEVRKDRKPIAYARFAIDEKGKRKLSITSVQGDGEYISEISKEQREKIEKLGFKFLEE